MIDNYPKDPRADTFAGWQAALAIFAKYQTKGLEDRLDTAAEHDCLYLPAKPEPLRDRNDKDEWVWPKETEADAHELRGLGFHWASDCGCWAKFT